MNDFLQQKQNYIISTKIILPHEESYIPFNSPNFPNTHCQNTANEFRYLPPINLPIQQKPSIIVKNRNISTIKYFNKININNNSAPNIIQNFIQLREKEFEGKPKIEENKTQIEEKCCKICFESNSSELTGKLIAPCKCSGSVKYIHEECLKTWLVSQNVDLKLANCELCNNFYKMEIKLGVKFLPKESLRHGLQNILALVCLSVFLVCLIVIITMFALQWKNEKPHDDHNYSYQIAILISCSIVAFVVVVLLYLTTKEACFVPIIKNWSIKELKEKKKSIKDTNKKKPIIDKKKIAPYPSFRIKPPIGLNQGLEKQIKNFFKNKNYSENDLFRNKNDKTKKFEVQSTIMKISSKKKLIEENINENTQTHKQKSLVKNISMIINCEKIVPKKQNTLSVSVVNSKNDLLNYFTDQIPQEFLMDAKEDDKILDILMEIKEK